LNNPIAKKRRLKRKIMRKNFGRKNTVQYIIWLYLAKAGRVEEGEAPKGPGTKVNMLKIKANQ
jgi:hypothetical protein